MAKLATPTRDVVQSHQDEIDLLRAMYPSADELIIDPLTTNILERLKDWCEDDSSEMPPIPSSISFDLILEIRNSQQSRHISFDIELQLSSDAVSAGNSMLKLRVRQPEWLTKAEAANLTTGMPKDDVFSAIEHVRDCANSLIASQSQAADATIAPPSKSLVRAWFYFPSISTKQKRDEIVRHAPSYALTGFLLAGKPGVLCLEGDAQDIDNYMKFIKSVSWSDIPSQHKKVSERYREWGEGVVRVFPGMEEITDSLEKRGERANRGDMKALETWLGQRGLYGAFSRVLM